MHLTLLLLLFPTLTAFSLIRSQPRGIFSSNLYTTALDWTDLIDGGYLVTCPNGDPGRGRLASSTSIIDDSHLSSLITIKEFDTDDEDRIRGCYNSHIDILQEAKKTYGSRSSDYNVLVLEDNISSAGSLTQDLLDSLSTFRKTTDYDLIHLAYIMYVPGLTVTKTTDGAVVNLKCGLGSALGTTAYIINGAAINKILSEHEKNGYQIAIPDLMAKLFPTSRYGAFPMPYHRAAKVKSLVNPQLDSLRELLFRPLFFTNWEKLAVGTQLSSNVLFISLVVSLITVSIQSGKTTCDALVQLITTGHYEGFLPIPVLSSIISLFTLLVLYQGVALAPPPPKSGEKPQ